MAVPYPGIDLPFGVKSSSLAWDNDELSSAVLADDYFEASGPVTHAAAGALTGQGSSVAGSAERIGAAVNHAATGALTGQGSTITGAASSFTIHASSGALVGQGSSIAGTAARTRQHAATGALTGQGSALAGNAARTRVHAAIGVLQGQGAILSGSANRTRQHSSTGTLTAQGATITGVSARFRSFASSGALHGAVSAISGSAERTSAGPIIHNSSGNLVGQSSMLSGMAQHIVVIIVPPLDMVIAPASYNVASGGGKPNGIVLARPTFPLVSVDQMADVGAPIAYTNPPASSIVSIQRR